MLRQPLSRALALGSPSRAAPLAVRKLADKVPAANTVEVFIDDKPVHVPPGTTILQVHYSHRIRTLFLFRCSLEESVYTKSVNYFVVCLPNMFVFRLLL